MTKKKFGLFMFIVTAVFAVIVFALSAVSVSYASWLPSNEKRCALIIGKWGVKNYTLEFPNREVKDEAGNVTYGVKYDFTLNKEIYSVDFEANTGETFVVKESGVTVGLTMEPSDAVTYDEATKTYTVIENNIITTLKKQPAPYSFSIDGDKATVTLNLTLAGEGGLTETDIENIIGGGNNPTGGVTSSGDVIKFDENGETTIELKEGETFVLCVDGVMIDPWSTGLGFGMHLPKDENGNELVSFDRTTNQFVVNKPGNYKITQKDRVWGLVKEVTVTEVHECTSKCETCGGCLDAACKEDVCKTKCSCEQTPTEPTP